MKKSIVLFIIASMLFNVVACSQTTTVESETVTTDVTNDMVEVTLASTSTTEESDEGTGEFSSFISQNYCSVSTEHTTAMFISLDGNGNVEGQSYEYRSDETSEEYEAGTIYGNIFTFSLSNLTSIDDNSYEADISSIEYSYDANTEEIETITADDATKVNVRNVFTAPLDGCSNSKVIIYTESMPISSVPEVVYPYLNSFGVDTSADGALLDSKVLYFEEAGVAFVLLPS